MNVGNFRVLVKQLFYGNEIQFQVSKLGNILQRIFQYFFPRDFFLQCNPMKIERYSFVKLSVGDTRSIFLWDLNSISNFGCSQTYFPKSHSSLNLTTTPTRSLWKWKWKWKKGSEKLRIFWSLIFFLFLNMLKGKSCVKRTLV